MITLGKNSSTRKH